MKRALVVAALCALLIGTAYASHRPAPAGVPVSGGVNPEEGDYTLRDIAVPPNLWEDPILIGPVNGHAHVGPTVITVFGVNGQEVVAFPYSDDWAGDTWFPAVVGGEVRMIWVWRLIDEGPPKMYLISDWHLTSAGEWVLAGHMIATKAAD